MNDIPSGWPVELPACPGPSEWSGGPQSGVVGFAPDVGAPIERPRTAAAPVVYDLSLPLTAAQAGVFAYWHQVVLRRGTRSFLWRDPAERDLARFRFLTGDQAYQIEGLTGRFRRVSFRAMRLPGPAGFAVPA